MILTHDNKMSYTDFETFQTVRTSKILIQSCENYPTACVTKFFEKVSFVQILKALN